MDVEQLHPDQAHLMELFGNAYFGMPLPPHPNVSELFHQDDFKLLETADSALLSLPPPLPSPLRSMKSRQHVNPLAATYLQPVVLLEGWLESAFRNSFAPLLVDIGEGGTGHATLSYLKFYNRKTRLSSSFIVR